MRATLNKATLYFENGLFLEAQSFGARGVVIGEAVFNTAMSGYEEVISDPSYRGQFVVFSAPEVGVVGVNEQDRESPSSFCAGILVRHTPSRYSNFRAKQPLSAFLQQHGVLGVSGLDTRALVGMLRDEGAMGVVVSTDGLDKQELQKLLQVSSGISEQYLIPPFNRAATHAHGVFDFNALNYQTPTLTSTIGVLDLGVKNNILNNLAQVGLRPLCFAHDTKAQTLIESYKKGEIAGVLLSNGPGDPLRLKSVIHEIGLLIQEQIPMLGICLGHQLLSIAHGYPTYKLKFGHHGSNHPVLNLQTRRIEVSAQNHNYCVPESIAKVATITHKNLFDHTIEGVRYKNAPILSVQHHPEASPGPHDGLYIFEEFKRLVCHG
ncbi:glutamine-hydrolyzing carbamoyl-phosphate synthase small subunit [Helicobacter ailurogastricus]|uniref:Carbamoyl phosphate synthase small chain n=1 Tax=Helicobacter ailurogastricus TaxID=1578720 RepID=A0A0K2XDT5_9HELI|nr:glutamine-hydrolyzing carbamoyl-phosphate synthase small subunit [Helicobacter ailurogastricus]CRF40830.1 Carbamoyl-phosphate synthase small chain [Helicobacter ailurogastricus]CRF42869.1 Carbamoyl-phosphate synthase small chain [Helicobacter ailurogastricus]CRF44065.1 Carbamoyl-phosphate synthase small chain [Helicobacter ailurogastricus]CRI32153.1 Carbamoyl-phosphate synthase small chain [Helicobacter ailurogastricus]BDQ28626.1 carbamoyl-phosphate synthase small chain [Helicobacter ailuro